MRWLLTMVHAIGRVLGITPAAGLVPQTQDSQTGGDNSIVERRLQLVSKELKAKRSRVQQDTQAQSSKTEISCAPTRTKKSSTTGTRSATPAPQPVKLKPKRKSSAAQSTTQAKSSKQKPKAVQAVNGQGGSQPRTRASKTRQHAK